MNKHLLMAVATLFGTHLSNANDQILFSSDFAPTDAFPHQEFDSQVAGWQLNAFNQRWVLDSSNAAVGSNGYFGEVFRDPGETFNAWWMSERLSVGGNMPYTVTFAYRATTDNGLTNSGNLSGEAHFYIRYWNSQGGWLSQNQQFLIADGVTIGTEGFTGSTDFAEAVIGEPDANGWRTITLSGTTDPATIEIDIWAYGANGDTQDPNDPIRFFGSFGIDDVEVILNEPPFQTVVASETRLAIEIEFQAEAESLYMVQSTHDLTEWTTEGGLLNGTGEPVQRFISTNGKERAFYRVVTD